jgi:hypothetical protein
MTAKITDFYIDSSLATNKDDINIILPHPIVIPETSKAYITIKNFTMLNSIYNISSDLLNNTFDIIATIKNYDKTKSGNGVALFDSTLIFKTTNPEIYHPIAGIISWNATTKFETLTTLAYNIYYYNNYITTTNANVSQQNSYLRNIFDPNQVNTSHYVRINSEGYLIFKKNTSISNGDFLKTIQIAKKYTKPSNPVYTLTPATDTYRAYGSYDGITWIEATNYLDPFTMEWTTENIALSTLTKTITFGVEFDNDYTHYKITFGSTQNTDANYAYFEYTKCYLSKYETTEVVLLGQTFVQTTYTIPDGVYSIISLNNYLNNLFILSGYNNMKATYIDYNYKWEIANNEPPYIYNGLNKNDLQFNLNFVFNKKLSTMLGGNDIFNFSLSRTGTFISPKTINLSSFKKLLLTSNLKLTHTPITNLINTDKSEGVGDALLWIDKDVAPFEYINWTNPTDYHLEIDNKIITNVNIKILNEFKQSLIIPSYLICFNISVMDK